MIPLLERISLFIDMKKKIINHKIMEYNSMFHYNVVANGFLRFDFSNAPKRTSLNFQYLDFYILYMPQFYPFMVVKCPEVDIICI